MPDEQHAASRQWNRNGFFPAKVREQRLRSFGLAVSNQQTNSATWLEKLLHDWKRLLEALNRT
jgi:hypothetical protein